MEPYSGEPIPLKVNETASLVVDAAICVHRELGPGLLESSYEACLVDELRRLGAAVKTQVSIPVTYKGTELKDAYRIDILVNGCLVVEVKSIESILPSTQGAVANLFKIQWIQARTINKLQQQPPQGRYKKNHKMISSLSLEKGTIKSMESTEFFIFSRGLRPPSIRA